MEIYAIMSTVDLPHTGKMKSDRGSRKSATETKGDSLLVFVGSLFR